MEEKRRREILWILASFCRRFRLSSAEQSVKNYGRPCLHTKVSFVNKFLLPSALMQGLRRLSIITGLDYWTGTLDWNTGMTFYLHFSGISGAILRSRDVENLMQAESTAFWSLQLLV